MRFHKRGSVHLVQVCSFSFSFSVCYWSWWVSFWCWTSCGGQRSPGRAPHSWISDPCDPPAEWGWGLCVALRLECWYVGHQWTQQAFIYKDGERVDVVRSSWCVLLTQLSFIASVFCSDESKYSAEHGVIFSRSRSHRFTLQALLTIIISWGVAMETRVIWTFSHCISTPLVVFIFSISFHIHCVFLYLVLVCAFHQLTLNINIRLNRHFHNQAPKGAGWRKLPFPAPV